MALRLVEDGAELIATNGASVRAAMSAVGSEIPIVFGFSADPVLAGLTDSLARPNHNATGVTMMMVELNAKRIEILKQLVPAIRRSRCCRFPIIPVSLARSTFADAL